MRLVYLNKSRWPNEYDKNQWVRPKNSNWRTLTFDFDWNITTRTSINVWIFPIFLFIQITRTPDLFIPHLTSPGLYKFQFLLNQLCMTYLFTKRESSLIFSALKQTCFLKSMLSLNFPIQWYSNIFNLLNILMILIKCILRWFSFNVTI